MVVTSVHVLYNSSTFINNYVQQMYMRRPTVPDQIYEAVEQHAREHDNSWHQALERVLEQKSDIELGSMEAKA